MQAVNGKSIEKIMCPYEIEYKERVGFLPGESLSSGFMVTLHNFPSCSFPNRFVFHSPSGAQWTSTVTVFSYALITR